MKARRHHKRIASRAGWWRLGLLLWLVGAAPGIQEAVRPAVPEDTRAGRWRAERVEKARQPVRPEAGVFEAALVMVEESLDGGWLGRRALGLPGYLWLALLGCGLVLVALVRGLRALLNRWRRASATP